MDRAAVFLDRDGTINEDVGYLADPNEFRLLPGTAEGIKLLKRAGFKVIVISNQSGIARGLFSEEVVRKIDKKMQDELLNRGTFLDAVYFCPHHPDIGEPPYRQDCYCRKPKPGILLQAAKIYRINLAHSYMVGDKLSDIEAGRRAGCRTILLLRNETQNSLGEAKKLAWKTKLDYMASNLYTAAQLICKQRSSK